MIISPNLPSFIILAAKTPARQRAMLPYGTMKCIPVKMHAAAVIIVGDKIRSPEFPVYYPLIHILS